MPRHLDNPFTSYMPTALFQEESMVSHSASQLDAVKLMFSKLKDSDVIGEFEHDEQLIATVGKIANSIFAKAREAGTASKVKPVMTRLSEMFDNYNLDNVTVGEMKVEVIDLIKGANVEWDKATIGAIPKFTGVKRKDEGRGKKGFGKRVIQEDKAKSTTYGQTLFVTGIEKNMVEPAMKAFAVGLAKQVNEWGENRTEVSVGSKPLYDDADRVLVIRTLYTIAPKDDNAIIPTILGQMTGKTKGLIAKAVKAKAGEVTLDFEAEVENPPAGWENQLATAVKKRWK